MKEKNIECQVVKDLITQETGRGVNRVRIVRWIVDGKDTGALLEKRNFYTTADGEEKMGKAKGLTSTDVNYIVQNWKELQALM